MRGHKQNIFCGTPLHIQQDGIGSGAVLPLRKFWIFWYQNGELLCIRGGIIYHLDVLACGLQIRLPLGHGHVGLCLHPALLILKFGLIQKDNLCIFTRRRTMRSRRPWKQRVNRVVSKVSSATLMKRSCHPTSSLRHIAVLLTLKLDLLSTRTSSSSLHGRWLMAHCLYTISRFASRR